MAFLDEEMHLEEGNFVVKVVVEMKFEEGIEDSIKGERKVKQEFESSVNVGKVGEVSPCREKKQIGSGRVDEHCWFGV